MISAKYLTDSYKKTLIKDAKYQQKQQRRAIESLTIEEHVKVRSIMSQLYCTTALQIALIDELNEMKFALKYPFIKDFMSGMEKLNTDLYKIAVKSEKDDLNRQEFEKKIENIISAMPQLSNRQLDVLENFIKNLKHKK